MTIIIVVNMVRCCQSALLVYLYVLLYCSRGLVLSVWSACASVGNIIGAIMASNMLKYGYEVGNQRDN